MKLKFGFVKLRYRGLKKNANQLFAVCALVNLYLLRKKLLLLAPAKPVPRRLLITSEPLKWAATGKKPNPNACTGMAEHLLELKDTGLFRVSLEPHEGNISAPVF